MKFKKLKKYRRIFYLLGAIVFVVIFTILQSNYKNTNCTAMNVIVLDSAENKYVTQSTVVDFIYEKTDIKIVGNKFKNIDLSAIEDELTNNYYIKNADVYRTSDDRIEIKINQKNPLARIYNNQGENFYIDIDGGFLPNSKNFASYVPVFNGNIPKIDTIYQKNINNSGLDTTIYKQIYDLSLVLEKNEFARAMIDQIYITEEDEFLMIPKIGDFKIIFGTNEDTEIKLRNLKAFYKEIAPKMGWNKYSSINLKFTNQVVCTIK